MEISNIKRKKKEKTLSVVYGYDFPKKKERRKKKEISCREKIERKFAKMFI